MRRGYYIIPKFTFGVPSDLIYAKMTWIPRPIRQFLLGLTIRLVQGCNQKYGLMKPSVRPLEMHPTLNSDLLYFMRHGKVHPKPGIVRFDGSKVHFIDGSSHEFDVVIFSTGYRTSFPFLDINLIDYRDATEFRKELLSELGTD